uniref:Uncharacterized protein n=1 Tax=Arundo donax TaxID=35708 RepID=A0A0A8YNB6_ARUDO
MSADVPSTEHQAPRFTSLSVRTT